MSRKYSSEDIWSRSENDEEALTDEEQPRDVLKKLLRDAQSKAKGKTKDCTMFYFHAPLSAL